MSNAYHYQNSFADGLSQEFQEILSLGFSPKQVPNLQLWLDTADGSTITKDGSNKVSAWRDKSGLNNHATQADTAKQPTYTSNGINGKPAIYSDGALSKGMGFNMPISVGDDYTVFAVIKGDTDTIDTTTSSGLNAYTLLKII